MADARLAASLIRMRQRRTGPLILELDLTDGIAEGPPADPLTALLTMRRTRLQDLLDGLRRAGPHDPVRGLLGKGGRAGGRAGQDPGGRGLSVEQATSLIGRGPFLAPQALAEGLVDGLMYRDEVYDQVRKEAGPEATLHYLQRYQRTQSLSDLPRRLGNSVQGIAPGQH